MRGLSLIVALFMALPTVGCVRQVRRDANTYAAEVLAGLQREKAASASLHSAAQDALNRGASAECLEWVHPALVIDAKAQPQAYRALWLAGLPYPNPDGSLSEPGEEQADPGPSGPTAEPDAVCVQSGE